MRLSEFINENKDQIIREWEEFAKTLSPDGTLPTILRDHVSAIIRSIVENMETFQDRSEEVEKSKGARQGQAAAPLRQQHDAVIRAEASAVKGGGDLFALYRWKHGRQQIIVGGGGRGALQSAARIGSATKSYARSKAYATSASPYPPTS